MADRPGGSAPDSSASPVIDPFRPNLRSSETPQSRPKAVPHPLASHSDGFLRVWRAAPRWTLRRRPGHRPLPAARNRPRFRAPAGSGRRPTESSRDCQNDAAGSMPVGHHGCVRRAMARMLVKGLMAMRPATGRRLARSIATAAPRERPARTIRVGSTSARPEQMLIDGIRRRIASGLARTAAAQPVALVVRHHGIAAEAPKTGELLVILGDARGVAAKENDRQRGRGGTFYGRNQRPSKAADYAGSVPRPQSNGLEIPAGCQGSLRPPLRRRAGKNQSRLRMPPSHRMATE